MAEKFSFPKLSSCNWITWKFRMEQLLVREELFWVVEEDKPEPVTDRWKRDDRKAKATIGLCVEETQIALIKDATSARSCWNALKDHYEKNTVTSRVSLLKKLCNKNLEENGNMVDHLLELDELFDRLKAANLELQKELMVAMVLRSLPESYDNLVVALEARADDDITLKLVKQKLTDCCDKWGR